MRLNGIIIPSTIVLRFVSTINKITIGIEIIGNVRLHLRKRRISINFLLLAEDGPLDGNGSRRIVESADGTAGGKGHREAARQRSRQGDDVVVGVLGEGGAGLGGEGDFREAVHDGRFGQAVLESEGDVAGDGLVVVAFEFDGGNVATGEAELDAAADVVELEGRAIAVCQRDV